MYEHMLKTSAKIIARLRYEEGLKENALFKDEISRVVAGKQGKVIASRFNKILPELQLMVAARTAHLDKEFAKAHSKIKQVVFLGIGLDFRIYRNSSHYQDKKIFELDLVEMIQEREKLEEEHQVKPYHFNTPYRIPCNFINESIVEKLITNNFSPEQPTFIIFEGCSMYFSKEENKKILTEVSVILSYNSESILWMDLLSHKAFESTNNPLSVAEFLSNIAKLGEFWVE